MGAGHAANDTGVDDLRLVLLRCRAVGNRSGGCCGRRDGADYKRDRSSLCDVLMRDHV
jgi:hypothetical protein